MHYFLRNNARKLLIITIINRCIYFLVGSLVGIGKATGLRGWYNMVCIYKGSRYQNRRNG